MLEGETQRNSLNHALGYSETTQRNGNTPSYLEPNRDSMQKPIGGLSATLLSELYKGTIYKGAIVFSEH